MPGNPPSTLPRQVGGFHLVRELGRGGMGVVYEAQEIDSGRIVALKVLAAELSVSGEAFERFRREARLAASISDVHCVFVYGAHQIEESPAIAMELVGGDTLQERITRGGSIPIETAVLWILDVIDGLEAAHRAGVIHRDVKPSNCFVGADGRVKIGDFGLSRTLERDIQLTQSGQFLGSPLYASPEQIRGRTVDARSDQYSCAATLYAVLTGRAPFGGSNVGEVLARILSEHAAPMRSIRIDVPSELERVVRRAMERDPEKRFRDLEAFRLALLPFSNRTAAAAPVPLRLTAWILDAILYGSSAAMLSTMIQTSGGGPVDAERRWLLVPLAVQLSLGALPILYFALSEALFAKSIGKWLVGIRIVSVGKGPPLWVRAIQRACLYEAVPLLLLIPHHLLPSSANAYAMLSLLVPFSAFVFRVSTMRKRNGWRGPHELWTGTRVVQSVLPFRSWRRKASPPENHISLAAGLPTQLGEYRILGLVGATHSGVLLHGRDERLERSVWIQFRSSGDVAGESRRALNRSNRLRWLESVRSPESIADIFESPGGCGVADWGQREEPLDWPTAERVLVDLADELARSQSDALWPETWSLNQVWIDRNWNARLLDEPIPDGPATLAPVQLVGEVAKALLGVGPRRELPPDLPVHAEPVVRALTGSAPEFADLAALREALKRTSGAPTNVERRSRSAQIAVSTALMALIAASGLGFLVLVNELVPKAVELRGLLRELQAGHVATSTAELTGKSVNVTLTPRSSRIDSEEPEAGAPPQQMPSGAELDEESRTWRETVLAYESVRGLVASTVTTLPQSEQDVIYAAQAAIHDPDPASVDAARAKILEQRGPDVPLPEHAVLPFTIAQSGVLMIASTTAMWTGFALLSTLIWPGGLTFRHFGMSIRRRRGRRGSRLFGFLRVALFAIPLTLAYGATFAVISFGSAALGWTLFAVVVALHIAGVVASIVDPTRGPIDRLLRSRIVPR